jgi:hypothetical protein
MSNRELPGQGTPPRANVLVRERHYVKSGFPAHPAHGLAEALGEALLKIEAERKANQRRNAAAEATEDASSSVDSAPPSSIDGVPASGVDSVPPSGVDRNR